MDVARCMQIAACEGLLRLPSIPPTIRLPGDKYHGWQPLPGWTNSALLEAYRRMRTIRRGLEERLHVDFSRGDIPGFVHLYAGEEAVGVGIIGQLGDGDRIASTHRGHGYCIAKGVDPMEMMKEIYGKKGGSCGGKGGSLHIADLSKGMMGANGILGAGAPLVRGAALAAKYRRRRARSHCWPSSAMAPATRAPSSRA